MILIDNSLFIEFDEMIAAGLKRGTILEWVEPVKVPHPQDKRAKLFNYRLLAKKYQDILDHHFKPSALAYYHSTVIKQFVKPDTAAFTFYSMHSFDNGSTIVDENIKAYCKAASWLNYLAECENYNKKKITSLGFNNKPELYNAITTIISTEGIDLPTNYSRLMGKLREYKEKGYPALIKGGVGNNNAQKIGKEQGQWLINYYSAVNKPTFMATWMAYNNHARTCGWPQLKNDYTVQVYLMRPEIQPLWYLDREGEYKFNDKFGIQIHTKPAPCREAIWFSDGTGLNFDLVDANQQTMYYVMDAHSEVILGWSINKGENHAMVFTAFRNALQFSQAKPYELRYDNGSAHKPLQPFFDSIVNKLHFYTTPNNGKSKPIENMNNRFQQFVQRKWWFYNGQNRTAHTDRSKQNEPFVDRHVKKLPLLQNIATAVEIDVEEWNNNEHPRFKGKTRLQVYNESINPEHIAFTMFDALEAFFTTTERPRPYRAEGIRLQIGTTKYLFEVLDTENRPHKEWRQKNIGAYYFVKYDPSDMSYVALYEETPAGLRFVTLAHNKPETPIDTMSHTPDTVKQLRGWLKHKKDDLKERTLTIRTKQAESGYNPDAIVHEQNEILSQRTRAQKWKDDEANVRRVAIDVYAGDEDVIEGKIIEE